MTWEVRIPANGEEEETLALALELAGSEGSIVEDAGSKPVLEAGGRFARSVVVGFFPDQAEPPALDTVVRLHLAALGMAGVDREFHWRRLAERDWQEAWKESWGPLPIGERLLVLPTWLERPPEAAGRLVIGLDPAMAFGSGQHETTRGCLEALERLANERPLGRVLDLGTGSGILAIGAALLGAAAVTALDNDPLAVTTCQENCARNGVAAQVTAEWGETPPPGPFDAIVANILASVLIELAPALTRALARPGGRLILSGLLVAQGQAVQAAYAAQGLVAQGERTLGEWLVLELG